MPIFASNIVVMSKQELDSKPVLSTTEQKIAKEKERIQKEKRALEIPKRTEERKAARQYSQKELRMFKNSSEETLETLIVDRSSEYVSNIVK